MSPPLKAAALRTREGRAMPTLAEAAAWSSRMLCHHRLPVPSGLGPRIYSVRADR